MFILEAEALGSGASRAKLHRVYKKYAGLDNGTRERHGGTCPRDMILPRGHGARASRLRTTSYSLPSWLVLPVPSQHQAQGRPQPMASVLLQAWEKKSGMTERFSLQIDRVEFRPSDAKLELNCRNRTDRRQGFTQTPGAERPMGGLIIISGEDPGRGSPRDPHRGATWTGPQVFFWNHLLHGPTLFCELPPQVDECQAGRCP